MRSPSPCSRTSCSWPPRPRPPARPLRRLRAAHVGVDGRDDRRASGLPADSLDADGTTSVQTSTTNIGAYLWSAVAAQRLGIISAPRARRRGVARTLTHARAHGALRTPASTTTGTTTARARSWTYWPPDPTPDFHPILSSVDNGWLAVGLKIVARSGAGSCRAARGRSTRRWTSASTTGPTSTACCSTTGPRSRRRRRAATTRWSARAGSSTTSASPAASCRTRSTTAAGARFPDTCDWSWQETEAGRRLPAPTSASSVFEGAYPYDGMRVMPSWGGSMFEALMPSLFVPEERWAPR